MVSAFGFRVVLDPVYQAGDHPAALYAQGWDGTAKARHRPWGFRHRTTAADSLLGYVRHMGAAAH